MRHLTVRVAWHDSGWDARVCAAPSRNSFCLALDRVREERNDAAEDALAGRPLSELSSRRRRADRAGAPGDAGRADLSGRRTQVWSAVTVLDRPGSDRRQSALDRGRRKRTTPLGLDRGASYREQCSDVLDERVRMYRHRRLTLTPPGGEQGPLPPVGGVGRPRVLRYARRQQDERAEAMGDGGSPVIATTASDPSSTIMKSPLLGTPDIGHILRS